MIPTIASLFGLVLWTILLLFVLVGMRAKPIFAGKLYFDQQGSDVPGVGARITRAHANSLEWLTIPGILLLYAISAGQTAVTDGLAMFALYARVGQSFAHIASGGQIAVFVRASLFVTQVVIWLSWVYGFYAAA